MSLIQFIPTDGWETLRQAIPAGAAKAVADRLHVCADHVRRWRREPLSDEAPLASGQRSPLDRVIDLMDAIFLVHPKGAAYIVDHIAAHHQNLVQASTNPHHWDKRADTAQLLREATEAVNALNLDAPDRETIQELVDARDAIDGVLSRLRSGPSLVLNVGTKGARGQTATEAAAGGAAASRGGKS